MLKKTFETTNDWTLLLARLTLGAVMFPHGAQKVLGWFGGYGLAGTAGFMTQKLGIPAPLAYLNFAAEFLGAILLGFGLLGRLSALGIGVSMAVAAVLVHGSNGFFMNWTGTQTGEGYEFHLLAIALSALIAIKGSGALSVDRWIAGRLSVNRTQPHSAHSAPGLQQA
ncbi:MAG: DoxX family protein [Armatimonadetes bacterium]|nr:DoxX family protein [Armatimonadota bacterium]